jgi:uncharacterized protein (TIGR02265 family)
VAPGSTTIRGTVLIARLAYVRKKAGEPRLLAILDSLPATDQAILKKPLWDAGFYPFELNVRLDAAIAKELSPRDPDRALIEMGRASAEENLNGAQKIFLAPGDPQRFMAMAPQIYDFYYTSGHRTYERDGADGAVLRTFGAEATTAGDCLTVLGWYERALELCGAREVRSWQAKCRARGDAHCEYRFGWKR